MPGIKVVFGGATISRGRAFEDAASLKQVLKVLKENGVNTIDSAQLYGESEAIIGEANAGESFTLDTKWKGGFAPDGFTKENIISTAKESLERLKVSSVDIFYIHAPISSVPLPEILAGVNEVYQSGAFKRFGLSNYQASDVEKVYEHCKEQGYVLPSVYQGNYSPVARKQDTVLFPVLRKLGISFYAYSPLAGGFLTKTKEQIAEGVGRFDPNTPIGQIYHTMYSKPAYLEALAEWSAIADDIGSTRADLAYRWVAYNSPLKEENGDGIIIGASSLSQLEQTLKGLHAGPLNDDTVARIDAIWSKIEHEAPLDNYHK